MRTSRNWRYAPLREYAAARGLWTKRGAEAPHTLDIRMARLLEKLGAEE